MLPKVLLVISLLTLFTVSDLNRVFAQGAHWEGVEVWEVSSGYPVHLNVNTPPDDWSADFSSLYPYPGIECWARAKRAATSSETGQGVVAFDISYYVQWFVVGSGGNPGVVSVVTEGAVRAYALTGESVEVNGGGDFGQGNMSGTIGLTKNTFGHSSPWSDMLVDYAYEEVSGTSGITSDVVMHPTAGVLQKPCEFKGYAKVTWVASVSGQSPPGGGP